MAAQENFFQLTANIPDSNRWGKSLAQDIGNAFDKVTKKITEMNSTIIENNAELKRTLEEVKEEVLNSVSDIETNANYAKKLADKNAEDIFKLHKKMINLQRECISLKEENIAMKKHSDNIELYSRRDNLIIHGVNDIPNESNAQCIEAAKKFIKNQLLISPNTVDAIKFVRCHRMGTPIPGKARPIIMRFYDYDMRELVWRSCSVLKGKQPYSLSEDFPRNIAERRRLLYIIYRAALSSGEYTSVKLKRDELFINGNRYTMDNINTLPTNINPHTLSFKTNSDVYVAGGLFSEYNKLSNWSKCDLSFRGQEYTTLEQCWQHRKAQHADDAISAHKIMCARDAKTAKELGRSLKLSTTQRKSWDSGRKKLMKEMVIAKVRQNTDVEDALRETQHKRIGESGVNDAFYTIGLKLTDKQVLDTSKWRNNNLMGKIYEEVRTELIN